MSEEAGKSPIYLLDTNVLIDLALWLPIDIYQKTWSQIEDALQKKKWVLLDAVVSEIRGGKLKNWCVAQKANGFVSKLDATDRSRGVEINNAYTMIDTITQKSTVDTYLIAHAERNGFILFTREALRKNPQELYKIPEVCGLLNIEFTRSPADFYRHIVLSS
jgi:predicted nucleic acid-binding protein